MSCVIDSSVAVSWVLDDERTKANLAVLDQVVAHGAVVPAIWHLEVANSLTIALRRERTTALLRDQAFADLEKLDMEIDGETMAIAWSATVRIADRYRLTAYDAAYLELAQRRRLPLATLDKALAAASQQAGVELAL